MRTSRPEVGRSQRPDLVAKQRGRRRLSSSTNHATSSENASLAAPTDPRCLIRRRRPRYPATAFTSPTERAGEPEMIGWFVRQPPGAPVHRLVEQLVA